MGLDKRLLVTGAGGQLGRALARLAPDAVLLDRRQLDVCDFEAVAHAATHHRPDVIVHTAAYTKVDAAEGDPGGARAVNVEGTRAVASAAQKIGALLVYPSTDYVFDGNKDVPYTEEDPTAPLSVYGKTKLEGERLASQIDSHLIVRTSWVFGEGHNFIRSILGAASQHQELTVVGDQRGLPTYALDLAGGILGLVAQGATGLFHLAGGGDPATWADLAEKALELTGSSTRVRRVSTGEYYSGRQGPVAPRPANSVLDCSKAAAMGVGLRPWPEAVSEYVKEMR